MRNDYGAALGDVATLRTAGEVRPVLMGQATLLEASAAEQSGDTARGGTALETFRATCPPLFEALEAFAAARPENSALHDATLALRAGGGLKLSPAAQASLRGVLAEPTVARSLDGVDELSRELKIYDRLSAEFWATGPARIVFAELTGRRSIAVDEAGSLGRRQIKRVTDQLARQIKRSFGISDEPLDAALVG